MTDQLALTLDPPGRRDAVGRARHADPETSHAAAAQVRRRSVIMALIEQALVEHPAGLTDWELVEACGLPDRKKGSVAKRRYDLGTVDTGRRRPSPDGRDCIVWRLP